MLGQTMSIKVSCPIFYSSIYVIEFKDSQQNALWTNGLSPRLGSGDYSSVWVQSPFKYIFFILLFLCKLILINKYQNKNTKIITF